MTAISNGNWRIDEYFILFSASIKIFKKEYINGREFDTESTYNGVLLQECDKEKPIFINNSKLTVCKRKDGFTQVRVYRNLN